MLSVSRDMLKELTSKNFKKEVLESKTPVLVDFWAPWCGPCRMMAPVVEELAKELKDDAKIAKVNIDDEDKLATEYGVMSIPTFILFKNGKIVDQASGVMSKNKLAALVKKAGK